VKPLELLVVSAIGLSTAACVADGVADPPTVVSRTPTPAACAPPACVADVVGPPVEHVHLGDLAETADPHVSGPLSRTNHVPGPLPETADGVAGVADVCACQTKACVDDWVNAELGCDVCATLLCDGRVVDDCVLCPTTPDAGSCAAAAAGCGLKE